MIQRDLVVDADNVVLPATLTLPTDVRAGIVTMHPAISPDRDYFLLANVARILPPQGVAVLRYDRRSTVGIDVPFAAQAAVASRGSSVTLALSGRSASRSGSRRPMHDQKPVCRADPWSAS